MCRSLLLPSPLLSHPLVEKDAWAVFGNIINLMMSPIKAKNGGNNKYLFLGLLLWGHKQIKRKDLRVEEEKEQGPPPPLSLSPSTAFAFGDIQSQRHMDTLRDRRSNKRLYGGPDVQWKKCRVARNRDQKRGQDDAR